MALILLQATDGQQNIFCCVTVAAPTFFRREVSIMVSGGEGRILKAIFSEVVYLVVTSVYYVKVYDKNV